MIVRNSLKPNTRRKLLFVFTCVSLSYDISNLYRSLFLSFVSLSMSSVSVSPTFTLVSLSHTHTFCFCLFSFSFKLFSLCLSLYLSLSLFLSLSLYLSSFSICSLSSLPLFIYLHYFTSAMSNNTKLASNKKRTKKKLN